MTTEAMMDQEEAEEDTFETCCIWQCQSPDGVDWGFLVTPPGDLNRPIAFVPLCGNTFPGREARGVAFDVLECPQNIHNTPLGDNPVLDLRPLGKIDSNAAIPRWIYAMKVRMDTDNDGDPFPYQCTPPCKFFLSELTKAVREIER